MPELNQRINFYQDQFRKPVILLPMQQILGLWVVTLVFLIVVSVLDFLHTNNERDILLDMERSRTTMEESIERLQQRVDAMVLDKKLEAEERRLRVGLQSKRHFLTDLQEQGDTHQVEFSGYLQALANMEAKSVWLTRIRIQSPGPQVFLAGVTNRPNSIPEYMENLKHQTSFTGMGFKVFNLERGENDQGLLTFSVGTEHDEAVAD